MMNTTRRFQAARSPWLVLLLFALLATLAMRAPAHGAGPVGLVKDIRTDVEPWGSEPREFVRADGVLFFTAWDLRHGRELWRSDGTPEGTRIVKDIWPGGGAEPFGLTDVGGTLFFTANDGIHGHELWRSDGTAAGTWLVKDLEPGPEGSFAGWYRVMNGTLFFTAGSSISRGLWRSDGTANGTVRITPADIGADELTVVGGTLFFKGNTSQIWRSDGTPAGTRMVKDLRPGWWIKLGGLTSFKNQLFFVGDDGVSGAELWRSDGTEAGTRLVKDIHPTDWGIFHERLTVFDGKLYFFANDGVHGYELWRSDGTGAGTQLVKDINPGPGHARDTDREPQFARSADKLYFVADDGAHGYELWKTRGSTSSTQLVKDINPGRADGRIAELADLNGTLYFGASDGRGGLWRSDAQGTMLVKRLGLWDSLRAIGDRLFFAARDERHGIEPWTSDGSEAGTAMLADLEQGGNSDPAELTELSGMLFFTADDGATGRDLWRSDGTAEGTVRVLDVAPGEARAVVYDLTPVGRRLFFAAEHSGEPPQYVLWASDGTAGGTAEVRRFTPEPSYEPLGSLMAVGERLFFVVGNGERPELWVSDGTDAGTVQLKRFTEHEEPSIHSMLAVGDTLYFVLHDHDGGTALWRSDGTAAGTVQIALGAEFEELGFLTLVDNRLFFVTREHDGDEMTALWKLDLPSGAAVRLREFGSEDKPAVIHPRVPVGDTLLFGVSAPETAELWRSDGTPEGTVLVKLIDQPAIGQIHGAAVVHGALLFGFGRFQAEAVLWRSDGTPEGTVPLASIGSGPGFGGITHVSPEGRALFAGSTALSALELWQTDGTAAGTGMLFDLAAGPESSNPSDFTVVGNRVFFTAADREHGRELWALDRAVFSPAPSEPSYDQALYLPLLGR
jgi:ELWxxDGT repeat protein